MTDSDYSEPHPIRDHARTLYNRLAYNWVTWLVAGILLLFDATARTTGTAHRLYELPLPLPPELHFAIGGAAVGVAITMHDSRVKVDNE